MIPNFRNEFKKDLATNFKRKSNNGTKQLFLPDIEKEAIMYACSMCIEYRDKAGSIPDWIIDGITNQVCDVIQDFFSVYDDSHRLIAINTVLLNMRSSGINKTVENYYESF